MSKHDVPFGEYTFGKPNYEDIGGRATDDAEQLAGSIYSIIREFFPINKVPTNLVADQDELQNLGIQFKKKAEALVYRANYLARNSSLL